MKKIVIYGMLLFGLIMIIIFKRNAMIVLSCGVGMVSSLLLYVGNLPKDTNLISFFMNK